ncbi:MAG: hypothetical protein KAW90_05010 [Dehalococcoidales bacterium]|nr:hypothetical protein [Dehalococcoidales bacterium]
MAIDKILQRLDSLISMGGEICATRHNERIEGVSYYNRVEVSLFLQWRTSSLAFLNTLPSEYVYRNLFEENCRESIYDDTMGGLAVLQAAKDDIAGGYLQKVETLVSAEVFSDFLGMAQYLLDNGYKDPAASLIGAVLEDGLRRICNNNGVLVKSDDNISSLNQKLADKDVYNRLQQREIEVSNKLRDYADHGHFDEYSTEQVKDMLTGVGRFMSEHLK